jgi:hypothetical protein
MMAVVADGRAGDQQEALLVALDQALGLLRQHGATFWADWLAADRAGIARGERPALEHLLGAFGGMGSFNDLVISPLNGHAIDAADVAEVNDELWAARERIWTAAKGLERE